MSSLTSESLSRRSFVKISAAGAGATLVGASLAPRAHGAVAGSDRIRVGVIGCGGRGTGAAQNCLDSAPGVEIVALGDLFEAQVENAQKRLKLPKVEKFWGFDAYQKVIASQVDLVILTTPPGFRPLHFEAAVAAGKHVFIEKPVAVDPVGCRAVIAAAKVAKQKKLAVVAGTQRRHQPSYLETMKRIHGGDIGELVGGQCYWNGDGIWFRAKDDPKTPWCPS